MTALRSTTAVLPWSGRGQRLGTVLAGLLLAVTAVVAAAQPASAAPRVTFATDDGTAPSPSGATRLRVSGEGFQVVPGGFGGVYVFFGWVDDPDGGSWRPSRGGVTGRDYLYMPDSEDRENQGYQRFVTFPGSQTATAANGGEMAADGSWSLTMQIPGARFEAVDRSGSTRAVDCTTVTCGLITIGAHGVSNANNETFTPITFATGGQDAGGAGVPSAGAGTGAGAGAGTNGQPAGTGADEPRAGATTAQGGTDGADAGGVTGADQTTPPDAATLDTVATDPEAGPAVTATADDPPAVPATVGVDQSTAMVGRVLAFAGQGFLPGEQVVAVLDDGTAAVGPLQAGASGEVAGVLQLPPDVAVGTHTLRLSGAASAQAPEIAFTVRADPVAVAAAEAQAVEPTPTWVFALAGTSALLLLALLVSSVTAGRRRRAARRRARPRRGAPPSDAPAPDTPPSDAPVPGAPATVAVVALVALGLTLGPPAAAQHTASPGSQELGVTIPSPQPTLRWGLNHETSSAAYFGECNFLSAGLADDVRGGRPWTPQDGLYRAEDGNVRIEKPGASGSYGPASWTTRCLDRHGRPVSVASTTSSTESQVVIRNGRRTVDARTGVLTIAWEGSFTVAFYGGLTSWSASDPTLRLQPDGSGQLTATASGYGADMDDPTRWVRLEPRTIVLADLSDVDVGPNGFSVVPDYLGVAVDVPGDNAQAPRDEINAAYWGAFPQSFVDFQLETGQGPYWYTSNGARDPAKPTVVLEVVYHPEAHQPAAPPGPPRPSPRPPSVPSPTGPNVGLPGGSPTGPGSGGPGASGPGAAGPGTGGPGAANRGPAAGGRATLAGGAGAPGPALPISAPPEDTAASWPGVGAGDTVFGAAVGSLVPSTGPSGPWWSSMRALLGASALCLLGTALLVLRRRGLLVLPRRN